MLLWMPLLFILKDFFFFFGSTNYVESYEMINWNRLFSTWIVLIKVASTFPMTIFEVDLF